jgi:hypothetical protein
MPTRKHAHHLAHYLPLYGVLTIGAFGIYYFRYDLVFQRGIIIATAIAYFSWGVVHHKIHDDLNLRIILEYLGIALLGLSILLSVFS